MIETDRLIAADTQSPQEEALERALRPKVLDEYIGQEHLTGPGRLLRRAVEADRIPSMILWGPPGTGKTTLARIIAARTGAVFETVSATDAGVKDLRAVVERARRRRDYEGRATVLFVDEIHRFSKAQQDALLPHVEAGVCTLIGATTENPSFEVNAALLSRVRVVQLRPLALPQLVSLLRGALEDRERGLGAREVVAEDRLLGAHRSGGRERDLVVELFVHPAGRHDHVPVGAGKHVVVRAHVEFASRQRSPALGRLPGRIARRVLPAGEVGVARRIVDLVDRLRPRPLQVVPFGPQRRVRLGA